MSLTNKQLTYYDHEVLRLPAEKRTQYHAQVDRLISELKKGLHNRTELKVTKVVKAGSFAKYTILRKTSNDAIDVDVVFYIDDQEASEQTFEGLSETIYNLLVSMYPNKSVEDFEIQRRAATVQFVGSGLAVDVVPVIQDKSRPDYGWQFDINDGTKNETCAPCQIGFVQKRKDKDKHFRTLVRMAKRWRNHAELSPLKSFHIELILAYLLDRDGALESIEKRFRDFLLYIAQSGLKERVDFLENKTQAAVSFDDIVIIIDPVNNSNNVASRITETERQEIVSAAKSAWETATHASTEDDIAIWKELFGPRFKIEEEN